MVRKTTCKKTRRQLKSLSDKFVALQASEKHCVEIQESLRCAHQQLLDIIEFFPDAILVIDGNKRVIAWNRELEEMTGIKKKDILGKGEYSYSVPFYGTRRPILIDLITTPNQRIEVLITTSGAREKSFTRKSLSSPCMEAGGLISGSRPPLYTT